MPCVVKSNLEALSEQIYEHATILSLDDVTENKKA